MTDPATGDREGSTHDSAQRIGGILRLDHTCTDPQLCAAIVDRLMFGGNIIKTGTGSYRLARTRAHAGRRT